MVYREAEKGEDDGEARLVCFGCNRERDEGKMEVQRGRKRVSRLGGEDLVRGELVRGCCWGCLGMAGGWKGKGSLCAGEWGEDRLASGKGRGRLD